MCSWAAVLRMCFCLATSQLLSAEMLENQRKRGDENFVLTKTLGPPRGNSSEPHVVETEPESSERYDSASGDGCRGLS